MNISTGTTKVHYDLFIRKGSVSVRLLLDSPDKAENKKHYRMIEKDKDTINESFGNPLQWNLAEENKTSVIFVTSYENGGYEQSDWKPIFKWLLDTYILLSKILHPILIK